MKTLDLVVLRAIMTWSGKIDLPILGHIECLELAKEACDSIYPDQKYEWIRAKIVKLCEKILQLEMDIRIQLMVCPLALSK